MNWKERKPNRLQGYDYSSDNLYFVTSCVQNRVCCFGEIFPDNPVRPHSPKIILNEYGEIAEKQWHWLAVQYPYVVLHAFVVMPNHIHGIIEINRNIVGTGRDIVGTGRDVVGTGRDVVGTGRDLSLQPKIKSLSELIGAYKTTVSKQIHLLERTDGSRCTDRSRPVRTFAWQRSFYEHIIRDEKSFETISDYILNNPINWEHDNGLLLQ
jgi:putative transposase